jgi:predicted pyridoxine 5'-phosphate oxidase superfamily flavin-nucleotide-binding protein
MTVPGGDWRGRAEVIPVYTNNFPLPGQQQARARWGTQAAGAAFDRKKLPYLTGHARTFMAQMSLCVLSGLDEGGEPGGLIVMGPPGFVHTADAHTCLLRLDRGLAGARIVRALLGGGKRRIGLFFICHPRRERLCVYGTAEHIPGAFSEIQVRLRVEQAFFHCARYIRTRVPGLTSGVEHVDRARRMPLFDPTLLGDAARAFIARALLCFVCTADGEGRSAVNHRNGRPGFLVTLPPDADAPGGTLLLPDSAGNGAFEANGNILETGRAALVIPDYPAHQALCVSGAARLLDKGELSPELARRCPGAERVIAVAVRRVEIQGGDWFIPLGYECARVERLAASRRRGEACVL